MKNSTSSSFVLVALLLVSSGTYAQADLLPARDPAASIDQVPQEPALDVTLSPAEQVAADTWCVNGGQVVEVVIDVMEAGLATYILLADAPPDGKEPQFALLFESISDRSGMAHFYFWVPKELAGRTFLAGIATANSAKLERLVCIEIGKGL